MGAAIVLLGTLGCDDSGDQVRPRGSAGTGEPHGGGGATIAEAGAGGATIAEAGVGGVTMAEAGVGGTDGPPLPAPVTTELDFSPVAISADGSVVVGNSPAGKMVRWTAATGTESLTEEGFKAFGVSSDGSVVTGTAVRDTGIVRVVDGVLTEIDSPRADDTGVFLVAASADGNTIIGTASNTPADPYLSATAFRWSTARGCEELGMLPGDAGSEATALSPDGKTIVGNSISAERATRPFRWTEAEGMVALPTYPQSSFTTPEAVNDTGMVLGTAMIYDGTSDTQVVRFRWLDDTPSEITACSGPYATGTAMTADGTVLSSCSGEPPRLLLAPLNGDARFLLRRPNPGELVDFAHRLFPVGMSADAGIVVGILEPSSPALDDVYYPVVWTKDSDLSWPLGLGLLPIAVSADGSVIIGTGSGLTSPGWLMAWR